MTLACPYCGGTCRVPAQPYGSVSNRDHARQQRQMRERRASGIGTGRGPGFRRS